MRAQGKCRPSRKSIVCIVIGRKLPRLHGSHLQYRYWGTMDTLLKGFDQHRVFIWVSLLDNIWFGLSYLLVDLRRANLSLRRSYSIAG